MPRLPPPSAEPSPYITRSGYDALQAELRHLWRRARPALVQKVAEAAAMGDRSENAEYIYGKKQLREMDRRIAYLSRRLDRLEVVERMPPDRSRAFFGAFVELARTQPAPCADADGPVADEGAVRQFRLVGPDEADAAAGCLSIDSPVARALLGKQKGARVAIGDETWRLASIRYDHSWGDE